MMHPTFQLLERWSEELQQAQTHWFDAPEQHALLCQPSRLFSLNHQSNNTLTEDLTSLSTSSLNVLFYPKAKERLNWWLYQITQRIKDGQRLWVVGENKGGIKSLAKRIEATHSCQKLDSARHCALFELTPTEQPEPIEFWNHYTTDAVKIFALPGVFSAEKLDKGTKILLANLPALKGNVLEFGCGAGAITATLANSDKIDHVTAAEIDLLAVKSTQRTLNENQLFEKATVIWSDGLTEIPSRKFDAIITNPPFHKGVSTSYTATESFFNQAHLWLKTGGQLVWVANDFLHYESELEKHFKHIKVLAHQNGFKVFSAIRAKTER